MTTSERAEKLKERVENAILQAIGPRTHEGGAVVLRAVVEELGVRPGMVGHMELGCSTCDDIDTALATLLEAAGDNDV